MPTNTAACSVGDKKALTANLSDNSTDATVRFLVKDPSGNVVAYSTATSPAVVVGSTGDYTVTLPVLDEAGDWLWRVESTGTVVTSTSGRFAVRPQTVSTG